MTLRNYLLQIFPDNHYRLSTVCTRHKFLTYLKKSISIIWFRKGIKLLLILGNYPRLSKEKRTGVYWLNRTGGEQVIGWSVSTMSALFQSVRRVFYYSDNTTSLFLSFRTSLCQSQERTMSECQDNTPTECQSVRLCQMEWQHGTLAVSQDCTLAEY